MKKCTRIGIDLSKRCNWACKHCFYRWSPDFNIKYDKPVPEMKAEILQAKIRGCDHVVAVGWGEPTLYPYLEEMIMYSDSLNMTTSIITNGMAKIELYEKLYNIGLNHIHLSTHGTGELLNDITECSIADKKHIELKKWLKKSGLPWRANITLQQINYKNLLPIAQNLVEHGCRHVILLGFLPHYEWGKKLNEVAVSPSALRPYIEDTLGYLSKQDGCMATLRYHPFCHLTNSFWKYIVNANHVLYDPWEWEYGKLGLTDAEYAREAFNLGESVSITGEPCARCIERIHCGGWNKIYADAFNGAELQTIDGETIRDKFYYHDQNPANNKKGWFE
jgi:MoaA/NifB/PqqE/SkfB family radical SAM enzyme